MILEIIEDGGIYGYYKNNQILYVGKTKDFTIRNQQHYNDENPTDFEKLLRQDNSINFRILYSCKICPLTAEQLDYLETCYISILKPEYNVQKINRPIISNNIKNSLPIQDLKLTKTGYILYNTILENFKTGDKFTKQQITNLITIPISESSIRRGFTKLIELNILEIFYTSANNEIIYIIK